MTPNQPPSGEHPQSQHPGNAMGHVPSWGGQQNASRWGNPPAARQAESPMMAAVQAIHANALQQGMQFREVPCGGIGAYVYRDQPMGVFTRIHPFLVVGILPSINAHLEAITAFNKGAIRNSIKSKGGLPRGLQTGTATITVIITDQLAPNAMDWATKQRNSRVAAVGFPVTVETNTGRISYPNSMVIGAAYARMLREFTDRNVSVPLQRRY